MKPKMPGGSPRQQQFVTYLARLTIIRFTFLCFFVSCVVALAATPVASVDFTGGEQGRILIDAQIDGEGPFPFLFDTGSVNIISLSLATKLGAQVSGKRSMNAFGGPVETATAVLDSIKLGSLTMGRTEVVAIAGGPFTNSGPVGMLGWEFLSKLVVEVDYQHGKLNFFDPATYSYPGHGVGLPMTVHGHNMLVISGTVFGSKATLQLDSGSEAPLVLFKKFVQEHDLHSKLEAVTGYGFGGLTIAMVMRAPLLTIGGYEIKSPIVHLSLDEGGIESGVSDGNIGGPVLRGFTCVYDVPHSSFYLEPNAWFGKQPLEDRSGLVLDTRGASAKVLFVYPGSPAAQAGIAAGDELTDGDGRVLSENQWRDLFDNAPGATVRLTAKHLGRTGPVKLTLRDYL